MVEFLNVKGNRAFFREEGNKTKVSRVFKEVNGVKIFTIKNETYQIADDQKSIALVTDGDVLLAPVAKTSAPAPVQSEFDINQRFGFLEKFTNMTLDGDIVSSIVAGEAGIGKSQTIFNSMESRGLEEGVDYIIIKGYSTPKALYATLYENLDKIVVFDDCDSVLKDPISVNLLKGALDSYSKRTISWLSKGFIDDGLPSSFDFQGKVIFISNLPIQKLDGAVKSRSMVVDLSMTLSDKIERMETILPDILPEVSMSIKLETLDYMKLHAREAVEFNLRTLQKCIKVCAAYNGSYEWKNAVKYLLTNV